jgi:CubicO group peptidase (beta-lactamase class C family)
MTSHSMRDLAAEQRLPQTYSVIMEGIDRKLHSGCQLYISHHGHVIVDCGVGDSFPHHPMTAETVNLWLSAGKPLTAAAIMRMWERGLLRLDDPVSRFIPEFSMNGKGGVTIRHVLTHTSGFRNADTGWPDASWGETIRRICQSPLEQNWIVGRTAGYHTSTSWFILGEILARLTGRTFQDAIRIELLEPCGLFETRASFSASEHADIQDKLGRIYFRDQGELSLLDWHEFPRCNAPSPGANLRGPIRDLGRFYEMLLNEGISSIERVLSPQTVSAMTARHRVGENDLTLAHTVDFGLGVIVDSNRYGLETVPYGYGKYCSPRTFGHGGAQSSQGWCDPEAGLVVAYFFNGRPGEAQHNRRARKLNDAIWSDLGLA